MVRFRPLAGRLELYKRVISSPTALVKSANYNDARL